MIVDTTRRGSLARLLVLLGGTVAALIALDSMSSAVPAWPPWQQLWSFLAHNDPIAIAFALLRSVAIGLCWYLLATTVLGLLARATRIPSLVRAVDIITLPSMRRLLRGVAGVSLLTSLGAGSLTATGLAMAVRPAVASAVPAVASQSSGPAPTMRVLEEPPPPTSPQPAGPPATMRVIEDPVPTPAAGGRPGATMRVIDEPTTTPPAPTSTVAPPPATETRRSEPAASVPSTAGTLPAPDRSDHAAPSAPASNHDDPHVDAPPAAPTPSDAPVASSRPTTWTIAPGDHLWHVSDATLRAAWGHAPTDAQTATYLQAVIELNASVFAVTGDPDLVFPGQVFTLPPPPGS